MPFSFIIKCCVAAIAGTGTAYGVWRYRKLDNDMPEAVIIEPTQDEVNRIVAEANDNAKPIFFGLDDITLFPSY